MGVTDVASAIGNAMGLKPERKQLLHRAALLHDLGKLRIPNSILDKPGKLDDAEWAIMRQHPALTRAILGRVRQFNELAFVAGAHHEKLDGTGYPDRLTAKDLSVEARKRDAGARSRTAERAASSRCVALSSGPGRHCIHKAPR